MVFKERVCFAPSDEYVVSLKLRFHIVSSGKQLPINLEDNGKINYTFLTSLSSELSSVVHRPEHRSKKSGMCCFT